MHLKLKAQLREGQGKGWRAKQEFADVVSLIWIISFIPIKFIFCSIVSDWQNQFTWKGSMIDNHRSNAWLKDHQWVEYLTGELQKNKSCPTSELISTEDFFDPSL